MWNKKQILFYIFYRIFAAWLPISGRMKLLSTPATAMVTNSRK